MAIEHDINIDCGADFRLVIELKHGAGQPMGLSGCTIRTQCREKITDSRLLWDFSNVDGTLEFADGFIAFVVSKAISNGIQSINCKRGFWDIELTGPNGLTTRLVNGRVNFNFQVTRETI